ncbi:MAG: hypothetical protein ABI114_13675, partial [Rhodanobacter sp.]
TALGQRPALISVTAKHERPVLKWRAFLFSMPSLTIGALLTAKRTHGTWRELRVGLAHQAIATVPCGFAEWAALAISRNTAAAKLELHGPARSKPFKPPMRRHTTALMRQSVKFTG